MNHKILMNILFYRISGKLKTNFHFSVNPFYLDPSNDVEICVKEFPLASANAMILSLSDWEKYKMFLKFLY